MIDLGAGKPPGVVYFYAPGRAGENAETFLTGFDGILQIFAPKVKYNSDFFISGL